MCSFDRADFLRLLRLLLQSIIFPPFCFDLVSFSRSIRWHIDFFVNNISFENLKSKEGIMKKEVFGVIYDFLYCRKNLG